MAKQPVKKPGSSSKGGASNLPPRNRWLNETETESDVPQAPVSSKAQPKKSDCKVRTITTILMLLGFIVIFMMGHAYASMLVFFLNVMIFRELINIKRREQRDRQIPYFNFMIWYFFVVCIFYLYGRIFEDKLYKYTLKYSVVAFIMLNHALISFMLYAIGILLFVLSLVKGQYRYQMGLFGWTHLALLLCVLQSSMTIVNLYNGLIWLVLPSFCIIANDTFAYIFGRALGRTPLIQLSPKKTWEGFIGGFLATLVIAYLVSKYLSRFQYLICPQPELNFRPFQSLSCQVGHSFMMKEYELPAFIGLKSINLLPIQLHALVFTAFASFIAPFGGFFASGVKRAFRIKDFGDTIPGHGGVTDRMDCQQMMATFVCIYTQTLIFRQKVSVATILKQIVQLSTSEQLELFEELRASLNLVS